MHIYIVLQQIITVTVAAADNYSFFFVSHGNFPPYFGKPAARFVCDGGAKV